MQAYLQTDPKYASLFKKVWIWNDFPARKDFGGKDTGIDLVALTNNGDYWAIQCKCCQEDSIIDKPAVDSFLSTSSKKFVNDNCITVGFTNRLWISTTNHWGTNAEEAIRNQHPPVSRISLYDLQEAPVDWEKLEKGLSGEVSRTAKKSLYPHQVKAVNDANEYFKTSDRGKLIMACGTGKTFVALKIAEKETKGKGLILFLMPSIALIGQALREWYAEANETIKAVCICSDPQVSQKKINKEDSYGYSIVDLALPASTNIKDIVRQLELFGAIKNSGMTVVFSTYQSIDVIARAQKELLKDDPDSKSPYGVFDLIICDEAHRTTGFTLPGEDFSAFVKVHDNHFLKAKKRLYMTATPRLYSDDSKSKAAQADAVLCSMDDEKLYGKEIYRIGFGEAVEKGLLSDYKVLILTISDKDVPAAIQKMIASSKKEINSDDASKLIGCINALSKQILGDDGIIKNSDPDPMKCAVAFCQTINISKKITETFNTAATIYYDSLTEEKRKNLVAVSADHIDGTMSAPIRDEKLSWLKSTDDYSRECRILTNVRCLSEGVDVPSLDAVMFLSAKNSQIDVVQSVGRVMRKAPGKKYGYIIIPVVVPSDVEPDKALDDNERYKVVWTVLNALRAHDDRFNATVNKIELNRQKPEQIIVGRPDSGNGDEDVSGVSKKALAEINSQLALQFEQLQNVVFARLVEKVGNKRYWEQWAKDVAQIAARHQERITKLVNEKGPHQKAFEEFLDGLQKNINPSIKQEEAIEMLSQHIITKPVFDALFEGYSFVKNNVISVAMQHMLDLLNEQAIEKDTEILQKFYESVKSRAAGIDNAEGRQRIIVELYDKFFKTAFPKLVEKLGIVYTPIEIVDFIIHSVNDVLKKEFSRSLSDENVHILDPFSGTGTFITRLLQSGLIAPKALEQKYANELHANEIVLLAYYIAAVNIESAYHDLIQNKQNYKPFDGICLTDTFQLGETDESEKLFSEMFSQNSKRVMKQKKASVRVIIGNPPYSVGQKSANDNAQNQGYPILDAKIGSTYAKESTAGLNKSLYDAYIKAFRWSTDRLDKNGGIVCFVSNGSWLDGNSTDGFRKCLEKEFSSIYVFNLRGNQRTSGERSRKEGGKIFGSGSRTPIAITLLVKNPSTKTLKAAIYYHDIGDYLSREEKLEMIKKYASICNESLPLQTLQPNEHGDWISQRNDLFETFIPIEPENKYDIETHSYFNAYSNGLASGRDAWVYNSSKKCVINTLSEMLGFYNEQRQKYAKLKMKSPDCKIENIVSYDSTKISWSDIFLRDAEKNLEYKLDKENVSIGLYRPFFKQWMSYDKTVIHRTYQLPRLFPSVNSNNMVIIVTGKGAGKPFSALATDRIPNYHTLDTDQCFPLYYYEERQKERPTLFDRVDDDSEYIRRDGISNFVLSRAQKQYGKNVSKEDVFYYVYGFLHNPEYCIKFANDLKKMLPRIPLVDEPRDFWKFSKAGRELADLHINYESVPPYPGVKLKGAESKNFKVEKMRFPSKDDKSKIIFNNKITIENIPEKAYEYVVNGKSAIEWIMERYQVTVNKDSGIKNDPNDWAKEVGNPRYILDLLLSIIHVSVKTADIVKLLPKLTFE